jgi:CubicO group peptidase (beta-lactamase class C family)
MPKSSRWLIATMLFALPCSALDALQADIERQAAEAGFSGTVLVAKAGQPVFQGAFGAADNARKIANTLETKFRFGSMGKMFTAVAIAQLAQAGKLEFDAPLGRYLTGYPNKEVAQVTLHQLLTHTGGTGDIFGPEFMSRRAQLRELRDYVELHGARGPLFPPGSRHEYSNYGFILLGRVIEVASGQDYDAYVRDHIFKPAGMNSTDNLPEGSPGAGLAIPYTGGEDLRSAQDGLPYRGTSAGGGYSTVGDLLRFATALTSHKLLDQPHTNQILSGKVETPRRGMKYAYGFEDVTTPDGRRRVGHGGGAPGMNGVLSIFPASDQVIVVLSNRDPPAAMEIDRFVTRRLSQAP